MVGRKAIRGTATWRLLEKLTSSSTVDDDSSASMAMEPMFDVTGVYFVLKYMRIWHCMLIHALVLSHEMTAAWKVCDALIGRRQRER